MQTFLPYPNFEKSAQCLDRARLGKQRVECLQILRTLAGASVGWVNHPAVRMWRGYQPALVAYSRAVLDEWERRGYRNTIVLPEPDDTTSRMPPWLGDEDFHASHRSNLLRKMPEYYVRLGWTEPPHLPYVWPEGER